MGNVIRFVLFLLFVLIFGRNEKEADGMTTGPDSPSTAPQS